MNIFKARVNQASTLFYFDTGGVVGPIGHGVFTGSNPMEAQATNGDIGATAGKGLTLEFKYPF